MDGETHDRGAEVFSGNQWPNVLLTIANSPKLLAGLGPLLALLSKGSLPDLARELVILRTAWHRGCEYEWAHHHRDALNAGLTAAEIQDVALRPPATTWPGMHAAVLAAVDDLTESNAIGAPTWDALSEHFTHEQILEIVVLTGTYTTLAGLINSCEVPLDGWLTNPASLPR